MNFLAWIGNVLRQAVRRVLRFYYPTIVVEGREHLPSGPVLFVANHPNSLMDPALIGYATQRPVHYFAKAPLFDVPVFGALMKALGMVPAYRGTDDRAAVRRNLETLELGARYLREGATVGIFPEGKTHDREGLELVRTGAARIAWSAVQSGAEFAVVPLGLNYERKERFRSSIWVGIGRPIPAVQFFREHGGEERKALRRCTEEIDRRLKELVVHVASDRWEPVLDELDVLLPLPRQQAEDPVGWLQQRRRVARAINYFLQHEPDRAEAMTATLEAHRAQLNAAGLRLESAAVRLQGPALGWVLLRETLWLLPGLGPFLAGAGHHLVPFLATRGLVRLVKHPGRATIALNRLLVGVPIYGLWYALVWWELAAHTAVWVAWLWTALMPLAGIEALHYAWRMRHAGRDWWSELKMLPRRAELHRLRAQQLRLSEQLREWQQEYARVGPLDGGESPAGG